MLLQQAVATMQEGIEKGVDMVDTLAEEHAAVAEELAAATEELAAATKKLAAATKELAPATEEYAPAVEGHAPAAEGHAAAAEMEGDGSETGDGSTSSEDDSSRSGRPTTKPVRRRWTPEEIIMFKLHKADVIVVKKKIMMLMRRDTHAPAVNGKCPSMPDILGGTLSVEDKTKELLDEALTLLSIDKVN